MNLKFQVTLVLLAAVLLCEHQVQGKLGAGSWRAADTSDNHVIEAARAATNYFNRRSLSDKRYMFVRIEAAQQQVVAGVQYRLSLVLQKSANCLDDGTPSSPDNDSGCTLDEAAGEKRFEANVWWRAWLNPPMEVVEVNRDVFGSDQSS
mmetsp:Transcript_9422/g.19587  ORF Transcript_9422/g.19587 Transcript_9422/m.19587 type:complete len:149 (-) Transcript_9422:35-481(-)